MFLCPVSKYVYVLPKQGISVLVFALSSLLLEVASDSLVRGVYKSIRTS